ncbi:GyrI-like domain-containing protein, partial [Odoribacter laneus]
MRINSETKYCQTCGIPLDIDYTNLKEGQNEEYCDYCLKNGVKLYDFSMDYLLYLWGLFPEEYNKEVGTNYTSTELREVLTKRLPEIKRWKQKINTAHLQYELIIKVQEYINRHLFDDLDSEKLAQVAGISKFHFRRLFKAVSGESLGKYILRLRLEYIAFKLISTDTSVPELLGQINYQNKHTLSRAFKSYFNCSISEFRKKHSYACPEGKNPVWIEWSIEKVPHMRIAYLKLERTSNINHSFSVLWKQILQFSERYRLSLKGCKYVSLTLDYPLITLEEHSRFMVGVTLPPSFKTPKGFGIYEIPSGEYAIFRFKGLYHELNRVYRHIYLDWLPTSDYTLREPFTFETYINTPEKTPASELLTDIYIPIIKKKNEILESK